jgi:hypothetical protein
MTVLGGEPLIDWDALAPHIAHPMRESIVEALGWVGPMSAPELKRTLGDPRDPEISLACVDYHLKVLDDGEALIEIGQRPLGASVEKLYFFPQR